MSSKFDSGYVAPQTVFVLLILTAMTCGIGIIASSSIRLVKSSRDYTARIEDYLAIIKPIMLDLSNDSSPDSDTNDDLIWNWDKRQVGTYRLIVNSLTGKLNPNFIRKGILESTELRSFLIDGKTPADLQQYRYDKGLSLSLDHYHDFFRTEGFSTVFSCYGFANINLADEFAIERYIESITGSTTTAANIRQKMLDNMAAQKLCSATGLRAFLGSDFETLFPFINAESLLNINFTDQRIISALVKYPPYKIENPNVKVSELLSLQAMGVKSKSQITDILGIDESNPLYYWFGCQTWFWKITIFDKGHGYYFIINRLPNYPQNSNEPSIYQIIEQGNEQ